MLTTSHRDTILNALDSHFCALLTAITDWRAGTVTEADYTGYSATRPGITLGSPADTSPAGGRQRGNSTEVTFGENTGSNQDVIAWGLYTANSGGTLKWITLLDADPPIVGTVVDTTDDNIVAWGHGLTADQRVFVLASPGAVIPTGLSENTAYYVGTVPDANHFTLSTTAANANPVNITAGGAALFCPYTPRTIATGATPRFATGALVLQI